MLSPVPPDLPMADLIAMVTGERSPELIYEPAPDYGRLTCPVLLQYGSEDTSVPVVASVTAIEAAMPATNPPTVLVYPGLEHMLNEIPTGMVGLSGEEAMYLFHDFRFGPTVLADLTRWLRDAVPSR
jgi:pimeloyl-ACP methyl ester carboxylesterase